MEEGVVGNKIQPVVSPKTGKNLGRTKRNSRRFSSFDRRCSGWFSGAWMAGEQRPASNLQIGTKLIQNGDRKWKLRPSQGRGFQVGFSGRVDNFSLSLCHTCICFPCFQLILLLLLTFNRLIFIHLHICYMP